MRSGTRGSRSGQGDSAIVVTPPTGGISTDGVVGTAPVEGGLDRVQKRSFVCGYWPGARCPSNSGGPPCEHLLGSLYCSWCARMLTPEGRNDLAGRLAVESERRHHHVGALNQPASPASHEWARVGTEIPRPPAPRRLVSVVVQKAPACARRGDVWFLNQDSWLGSPSARRPRCFHRQAKSAPRRLR